VVSFVRDITSRLKNQIVALDVHNVGEMSRCVGRIITNRGYIHREVRET